MGLQQFGDKLDRTVARCTELIDRLDRGPIELPSHLSAILQEQTSFGHFRIS